ncbi:MAG: ATP-binding protein [Burkholderiaceae bacterium]
MKKRLTTRLLLTFGLVSLVSSAMLIVFFLDVLPDRSALERENRLTTAELLSASAMASLTAGDPDGLQQIMDFARLRDEQLVSITIEQTDGTILAQSGESGSTWQPMAGDTSTDTQLIVPLFSASERWGQAKIQFLPIHGEGIAAFFLDDRFLAVALLSLICFVGFYYYLGRMLRHLDPSKAVPERVKSALDTLTESLLLIDAKGQIVLANKSFADLVDEPPETMLGTASDRFNWVNREHNAIATNELPWTETLRHGRSILNTPIAIKDASGRHRSFLANSAPIMGDKNTVNGALISLDDVTELEAKEVELLAATAHAEQANQAKSDFLANMSHEIRTPMNAVLGFTELMRRGQVQSALEANKYLDTIHRNGKHLLGLINDILDLSKVEAGEFQVESIAYPVHQVIHEVIDILQVKATEKNIGLRFEALSEVPASVHTDPARLRQVLTNLIGNAIKFTSEGEVVVTERYEMTGNAATLSIGVRDSGIGIPQEKLATIFDPFTQAESSTTRRFGGTGLGLTISRKFARAMGGDIVVSSVFGQGSEFLISLPVIEPADSRHATELIPPDQAMQHTGGQTSESRTSWRFDHGKVLVVDDSAENRQLVNVVLTDAGITVTEAENGQEAVDAVLTGDFDIVLMDMQMPVMDGYEATRLLRQKGVTTTIIAFTAHALAGFETEIQDVGCDGYLTKPIDIDVLLERISTEIEGSQIEVENATSDLFTAPETEQLETGEPDQLSPLRSRLETQPRLHPIIQSFVDQLPDRITQMQTELLDEQLESLAGSAHWLKGSAGSVGFDTFTEPSRTLEEAAKAGDLSTCQLAMADLISQADRIVGPSTSETPNRNNQLLTEADS